MPKAMGRSKPDPVFLRLPGARFTTTFSPGIANPEALMPARTRSWASLTAVSAIPTMDIPGSPLPTETSTVTGCASTPFRTALWTAHMPLTALPPRTR